MCTFFFFFFTTSKDGLCTSFSALFLNIDDINLLKCLISHRFPFFIYISPGISTRTSVFNAGAQMLSNVSQG